MTVKNFWGTETTDRTDVRGMILKIFRAVREVRVQRLTVLVVMAASLLFNGRQVQAQAGIELANVRAEVKYGESVTFLAEVRASIQIQQASSILYDETQGLTQVQPLSVTPDGRADFRFDTRLNLVRPFSTLRWYYEFALADGTTFQSDSYSVRYDDTRFPWQALEADAVRVHWYNGDTAFGGDAMNAAQAGLRFIGGVLPLDLAQPVDIFLYASEGDLQATLAPGGETWVAGHADPALGVVTVVVAPGAGQVVSMEERIPHELMHVMLYRQVGAYYVNLPAWLREGAATLVELSPNPDRDRVLTEAANRDDLIPLSDLCASFPAGAGEAFLAYAEARSFTNYLLATYGSSGLSNLASAYADGLECERGPERAFGVPLSQLERDWRASALGENALGATLGDSAPYLILLCLVLAIPLIAILSMTRKKGNPHGPETFVRN